MIFSHNYRNYNWGLDITNTVNNTLTTAAILARYKGNFQLSRKHLSVKDRTYEEVYVLVT